jgi:four helix bundle protein
MVKTHKDLDVYNLSIELVTDVYKSTKSFPKEESFGLTSQIRRSAVSIPANLAEGSARHHYKEFKQFLYIALASASELDTLLLIAFNLAFISSEDHSVLSNKLTSVSKMLQGLIKSINPNNN